MNEAMTIKEAAGKYSVTLGTLYGLIKAGKLFKHKQDGKILLSVAALEDVFYGICPVCCTRFPKENQRQRFCGKPCRQKASRSKPKG